MACGKLWQLCARRAILRMRGVCALLAAACRRERCLARRWKGSERRRGLAVTGLVEQTRAHAGCRIHDTEAKYYADGEDAYCMRKLFKELDAPRKKERLSHHGS